MATSNNPNYNSSKKRLPDNSYWKYSAMGLQMAAIIFLFTYLGIKLDEWLHLTFPAFTISLSLLSVILAIWFVVKDLLKK